eukprot:TRINITY_DN32034_c0_g1_i5.p1 TRINITY_DN32034_c0_g1~~TRINITY_DN32034_c0_g1_i5.p1  ORF type:complete len:325 (-),score=30.86 TRINITY_DN32034_c0_g1_i5:180-1154(-)
MFASNQKRKRKRSDESENDSENTTPQFQNSQFKKFILERIRKQREQAVLWNLRQLNKQYQQYFEEGIWKAALNFENIENLTQWQLTQQLTKISIAIEHENNDLSDLVNFSKQFVPNIQILEVEIRDPNQDEYHLNIQEQTLFYGLKLKNYEGYKNNLYIQTQHDLTIENSIFDGFSVNLINCQISADFRNVEIKNPYQTALNVLNVRNVALNSVKIQNSTYYGCVLRKCVEINLSDVQLLNCRYDGGQFEDCNNILIDGLSANVSMVGCIFIRCFGRILNSEILNCEFGVRLVHSIIKYKSLNFSNCIEEVRKTHNTSQWVEDV